MLLGRGKVENGQFVPTPDGKFIYTGFNNESIGDVFKTYDMSNVFSASVEDILNVEYGKELQRLESMSKDEMIAYIIKDTSLRAADLATLSRRDLISLLHNKFFGEPIPQKIRPAIQITQANIRNTLLLNTRQHGA